MTAAIDTLAFFLLTRATFFFYKDLVPQENVEKWIQCLEQEFPVVAFKASTQLVDKTVVRNLLPEGEDHKAVFITP